MLDTPCWVSSERSRMAGAAGGIGCRVIFAACLGWDAQNKLSQK